MIPEISELNWNYKKPGFEEVDDKKIIIVKKDGNSSLWTIMDRQDYEIAFRNYARYAILDLSEPDPDPLPYKGKLPIIRYNNYFWAFWGDTKHASEYYSLRYCPDRRTAILEWNEFVRKMES